jgi:hypothetical protein
MHILVFPIDMDKVTDFISTVKSLGMKLTGASSVMTSASNVNVDIFFRLPFITEESFECSFQDLISKQSITHIHTPHAGVWSFFYDLKKRKPEIYTFLLCEPSPYNEDWLKFKPSFEWAERMLQEQFVEHFISDSVVPEPLLLGQYASLHKQFTGISGQCDESKLLALAHITRLLPKGDLVEIGSLCGRSAFGIAWLSKQYNIGNLVCVDPWNIEKTEDQGAKADILKKDLSAGKGVIDLDKVFSSFIGAVSLLDNINFIRDISEKAVHVYLEASKQGSLSTKELGETSLLGNISMLHIDGNHRYDFVCKDIAAWEPLVKPGGWVLLDDYVWAFGDGPKVAGDELLYSGKFDIGFTMSDTLFLRKRFDQSKS